MADKVFKGLERRSGPLSSRSLGVQNLGMDVTKSMIPANEGPGTGITGNLVKAYVRFIIRLTDG